MEQTNDSSGLAPGAFSREATNYRKLIDQLLCRRMSTSDLPPPPIPNMADLDEVVGYPDSLSKFDRDMFEKFNKLEESVKESQETIQELKDEITLQVKQLEKIRDALLNRIIDAHERSEAIAEQELAQKASSSSEKAKGKAPETPTVAEMMAKDFKTADFKIPDSVRKAFQAPPYGSWNSPYGSWNSKRKMYDEPYDSVPMDVPRHLHHLGRREPSLPGPSNGSRSRDYFNTPSNFPKHTERWNKSDRHSPRKPKPTRHQASADDRPHYFGLSCPHHYHNSGCDNIFNLPPVSPMTLDSDPPKKSREAKFPMLPRFEGLDKDSSEIVPQLKEVEDDDEDDDEDEDEDEDDDVSGTEE